MPFIPLSTALAGIIGLFAFSPETSKPMSELAEILLRSERKGGTLTPGERELIAAYVSSLNSCQFCCNSHSAAAAHHFGTEIDAIKEICLDVEQCSLSEKMKAVLHIAQQVQINGKQVTSPAIKRARAAGATDVDIHDTVLIAAAFCMYNRYVDGLRTDSSSHLADYIPMGAQMAQVGYINFKME
jgi:uncharacterized peroxidase-related enzyme